MLKKSKLVLKLELNESQAQQKEAIQKVSDLVKKTRAPFEQGGDIAPVPVKDLAKIERDLKALDEALRERELALQEQEFNLTERERDLQEGEALLEAREKIVSARESEV